MADTNNTTRQVSGLAAAVFVLGLCALAAYGQENQQPQKSTDLLEMSIEQLMNVEVASTASLTKTTRRRVPSTVTTITKDEIWSSGARDLFELLDIYIPNFQWVRHNWEVSHMGLRGIINDRDDKELILVNGRVMNERTHYGALSERDLVMLQDIHHIDVIRGPGSALYGPGAISMVINIITENARTFQGTEATGRLGAIEEFYSGEFKHTQKIGDDAGLFLYGGASKYVGADAHDAPLVFGGPFNSTWGPVEAGEAFPYDTINRDGEPHRNLTPLKFHAEFTKADWDIWARYTRGGRQFEWDRGAMGEGWPSGWAFGQIPAPQSTGYQQATGYIGYKPQLAENLAADLAFSYDMFDYESVQQFDTVVRAYREDEYYGKALLNWQAADQHKIAVGTEVTRNEFGLKSPGWPDTPPTNALWPAPDQMPRWHTSMYSILGEHQWNINDWLTTFVGSRLDDHEYTHWLWSPRASIIFTPTDKDTAKWIYARSVRTNLEEEMRKQFETDGTDSPPEVIDSYEFRYERQQDEHLSLAMSWFIYSLDLISHSAGRNVPVGNQNAGGYELEVSYRTEKTRLTGSHSFSKLIDFQPVAGQETLTTAHPYGYGSNLANWSNHVTKLVVQHKLTDKLTLDGSARVYWGWPGNKDYLRYKDAVPFADWSPYGRYAEPGWDKAFQPSWFLNLGTEYKPAKNLTVRLDGFNLLGFFDKDLNKRPFYQGWVLGHYRCQAPALGVSVQYKF